MSDPDEQAHPPAIRLHTVGGSNLQLDATSLSGEAGPAAHATALLLSGQSFLAAARNRSIPMKLRGELKDEGLRLIHAALAAAKRAS